MNIVEIDLDKIDAIAKAYPVNSESWIAVPIFWEVMKQAIMNNHVERIGDMLIDQAEKE